MTHRRAVLPTGVAVLPTEMIVGAALQHTANVLLRHCVGVGSQ